MDGAFPLAAATRRAAAVGDDDREPLIGEPLRGEVGVVGLRDAQGVRAAVGVEQHRQGWAVLGPVNVVWEQHRDRQLSIAHGQQAHVRCQQRRLGVRGDLVVLVGSVHDGGGARSVEGGRPHDGGRAADSGAVDAGLGRDRPQAVVGPLPHVELRCVVDGVGAERDPRSRFVTAGRHDRPHLEFRRSDRFVADEETSHAVSIRGGDHSSVARAVRGSRARVRPTRRRSRATGRRSRHEWVPRSCRPGAPSSPADRVTARAASAPLRSSRPRRGTGSSRGPSRSRVLDPSRPSRCNVTSGFAVPAAG